MRMLIAILLLLGLAFGGWYCGSPWLAMKGIRDATRSADALERRIDFPALRESASLQLRGAIEAETGEGRLLEQIGGQVAGEIAGIAADRAPTPRGVANLVTTGALAAPILPEHLRGQEIEWSVERDGFNRFRGVGTFEDGSEGPVLHFERDGLSWTMVGVDLPRRLTGWT